MSSRKRKPTVADRQTEETPPVKRARLAPKNDKKDVVTKAETRSSTKKPSKAPPPALLIDLAEDESDEQPKTTPNNRRIVRARRGGARPLPTKAAKAKAEEEVEYDEEVSTKSLQDFQPKKRAPAQPKANPSRPKTPSRGRKKSQPAPVEDDDAMDIDEKPVEVEEAQELAEAESIDLPEEIWQLIFARVERSRLSVLPMVCKTWHKILSRDSFWIREIETIQFMAVVSESDVPIDPNLTVMPDGGLVPKKLVAEFVEAEEGEEEEFDSLYMTIMHGSKARSQKANAVVGSVVTAVPGRHYKVYEKDGRFLGFFEPMGGYSNSFKYKTLIDNILEAALPEISFTFEPFTLSHEYSYHHSKLSDRARFTMKIKINSRMFDREVMKKNRLEERARLLQLIYSHSLNHIRTQFNGGRFVFAPCIPSLRHSLASQPKGLTGQLKLHAYQLDAVGWMKRIEEMVRHGENVPYFGLLRDVLGASQYFIETEKDYAFYFKGENSAVDRKHTHAMAFKGGVFADEMGLGKTLTLLGLTMADPQEPPKALLCEKAEETPFAEAPMKLFTTNATLVICPNHVSRQWVEEIQKSVVNPKVVYLTTKPQHTAVTYRDIHEANYIVVTETFLTNRNHYFFLHRSAGLRLQSGEAHTKRLEWLTTEFKRLHALNPAQDAKPILSAACPILEYFNFRRIVLDEGHELLRNVEIVSMLNHFSSDFRWYMTGTPFPDVEIVKRVQIFLNVSSTDPECHLHMNRAKRRYNHYSESQSPSNLLLAMNMIENLYWRNIKASVKDSFSVPDTVEQHVLLEFTEIERALYDSHKHDKYAIRHICMTPISRYGQYSGDFTDSMARNEAYADEEDYKNYLNSVQFDSDEEAEMRITAESLLIEGQHRLYREYLKGVNKLKIAKAKAMAVQAKERKLRQDEEKESEPTDRGHLNTVRTDSLLKTHEQLSSILDQIVNERAEADSLDHKLRVLGQKYPLDKDEIKRLTSTLKRVNDAIADLEKSRDRFKNNLENIWMNTTPMKVPRLLRTAYREDSARDEPKLPSLKSHEAYSAPSIEVEFGMAEQVPKKESATKPEKSDKEADEDAMDIDTAEIKKNVPTDVREQFEALVFNHGTKMASLILYLKKIFTESDENRVILFSQNVSFLRIVRNFLRTNDIDSVFVEGNVSVKTKALREFKAPSSKVRVILLSIDKAASGTNLIAASHVILLDPAYGSTGAAAAKEAQAIGRAYRQGQSKSVVVVRFAIRDTIEHEYLLRNNEDLEESDVQDAMSFLSRTPLGAALQRIQHHLGGFQDPFAFDSDSDSY